MTAPRGLLILAALVMGVGAAGPAFCGGPLGNFGQTINSTPEIANNPIRDGMKSAPELLQRASLPCQLASARYIGASTAAQTHKKIKIYEVACTGAMGYILIDHGKDAPIEWATCLQEPQTNRNGDRNPTACLLRENSDSKAALAPFIAEAGGDCPIADARGLGHSSAAAYFEVSCQDGRDFVLRTSSPPSLPQGAQLLPCLDPSLKDPISCTAGERTAGLAFVDRLAADSGDACLIKDRRYVLTTPGLDTYYEVSCADGRGYMLQALANGRLGQSVDCAQAGYIGGGCTLTNLRTAQTGR